MSDVCAAANATATGRRLSSEQRSWPRTSLGQHLSTNHVIEFDPDRAVCISAMHAQHLLAGSPNGEFYLLRALYTDHMRRTDHGWCIEGIDTERRWEEGNLSAVEEAIHRTRRTRRPG